MYKQSFSAMEPDELLNFVREEAPIVLAGDSNAWLRLIDVARSAISRNQANEVASATYRTAALIALGEARNSSGLTEARLSRMEIRLRSSYLLKSGNSSEWKIDEALKVYGIFRQACRVSLIDSESLVDQASVAAGRDLALMDLCSAAKSLARLGDYLPVDALAELEEWMVSESCS